MNRNLERAIENLRKVEALMYAYEATYLDVNLREEDHELIDNRMYAFMAIQDAVTTVTKDLDRLAGDTRVIDVIQAIAEKDKK